MNPPIRQARTGIVAVVSIALAFAAFAATAAPARAIDLTTPSGLSRLLAAYELTASVRGIATFDTIPTAAQADTLAALGLHVQRMENVPLAVVAGTVSQLQAAVLTGAATDVYPDEAIQLFDTASTDAMGTATLRAAGLTGAGVTVGVVDSGCDASHPDLANQVVHNVKLYSTEYANQNPD